MALIKSYMSRYGIEGNYWRISGFEISANSEGALLHLELYTNKEARQKGLPPLETRTVQIVFNREKTVKLSDLVSFQTRQDMTIYDLEFGLRYIVLKEETKIAKQKKEEEDERKRNDQRRRRENEPDDFNQPQYPFNLLLVDLADAEDDI